MSVRGLVSDVLKPNCTGQGQSWLWRENLKKTLMYQIKKIPIPAETSSESFWSPDVTSKNNVLTSILTYFCQKSGRGKTLLIPPFYLVLLLLQPPEGRRSPTGLWSAVRCGASQHSNQFPVPGRIQGERLQVLSWVSSLTLYNRTADAAAF